jgi:acetate kinase
MRILVVNVGSATVKLSVTDMAVGQQLFKAELAAADGDVGPAIVETKWRIDRANVGAIDAVGHRVVHGGDIYRQPTLIDERVLATLESLNALAPLHNPPAIAGIRAARRQWPGVPQVAVFDTAFHSTMPDRATVYAVPEEWRRSGVRRFGFHGTSHKYVMERVAEAMGVSTRELRIISCHLGNGASVCAIERGVSIDTSMGMTPLEGLVMGTRSGDVDPGLAGHLQRVLGISPEQAESALYHRSGLAALSGKGNDLRAIEGYAGKGDARARLAIEVYAYRTRKYIGAYAAAMGGLDALAFTGGIGENSADMRKRVCEGLEFLGLRLDEAANERGRLEGYEVLAIHDSQFPVRVFVTQAREQWMIAQEVHRLLSGGGNALGTGPNG